MTMMDPIPWRKNMATVKRKKKPSCKNVVIGDGLRTKEESAPVETFPVQSVRYSVHTKQGAKPDHPKTLRVDYNLGGVFDRPVSEWVCVEHKGFARNKAEKWWYGRVARDPEGKLYDCPFHADQAKEIARFGGLRKTLALRVTEGSSGFPSIVGYELGGFMTEEEVGNYLDGKV